MWAATGAKLTDMRCICSWLLLLMLFLLMSCSPAEIAAEKSAPAAEVITYKIEPGENWEDTVYLFSGYWDPGAIVVVYVNGMPTCREAGFTAKTSGFVNTRLPGTYYLTYNATDLEGKALAAATKTVHVVENDAGFLNGNYNVACNCTVTAAGSPGSTLTTASYTATVSTASRNNHFNVSLMNIGAGYGVADAFLDADIIDAGFSFSPDYQVVYLSGNVSAAKNTFTMQSLVMQYTPRINYRCQNSYTRQLTIGKTLSAK